MYIELFPPGSNEPVTAHPDRVDYLKSLGYTEKKPATSKPKKEVKENGDV